MFQALKKLLHIKVKNIFKYTCRSMKNIVYLYRIIFYIWQTASSTASGDSDKYKMLMERLRQQEAQNSSLVLENETQRQQYEKCLDDIANQVVQALLTQKVWVLCSSPCIEMVCLSFLWDMIKDMLSFRSIAFQIYTISYMYNYMYWIFFLI